MKKTIILLLTVILILASCKQQIAPPQEPNTYTVTFVAGNKTVATKTYNEGEMLYTKLSEVHYVDITEDENKSYFVDSSHNLFCYEWTTSLKTVVTSDMNIEGSKTAKTAIVFFEREGGNVIDYELKSSSIYYNKSTAPAIPVKEGYEGYWAYSTPKNKRYNPHPRKGRF